MRLPREAHTERPWRIHEIAPDFRVEDVWALPTPGGRGELPRLVSTIFSNSFPEGAPRIVQFLWAARWKVGAVFGWDRDDAGLGVRATSLRERIPADIRDWALVGESGQDLFTPLYLLENEWAAELANRTVHAVLHLGWVPDESGAYHGQLAVLVKPNGLFGKAYMAAIKPFRHLFVYPALLRGIERSWHSGRPGHSEIRGQ